MRIVMANTYHYLRGGDSAYALGISQGLERRGHQVIPFAMHGEKNFDTPYSEYFAPELDYPVMKVEGGLRNTWNVASNSIYNRDARRLISRLFDEHSVEIVHLHSIMHHLTASIVLEARRRSIPIVWTLHDAKSCCPTTHFMRDGISCHECSGGKFYRAWKHRCKRGSSPASAIVALELYLHRRWRIYEEADLLITPSKFLRDSLLTAGLKPRRIEVLSNFVDTGAFPLHETVGAELLYVGRLSPEKGIQKFVTAVAQVPHLQVRIAGTGELETSLRDRIREEKIHNVQVVGHVNRRELQDLMRKSMAVVLPSDCDENCPLVILEAFSSGRAVLASERGGIPELVESGITGRLVKDSSLESWVGALEEMSENSGIWDDMGKRARKLAISRFGEESHLLALEGLYDEVLAASK